MIDCIAATQGGIEEIFELRVLIEGEVAGHAARHIGQDEIAHPRTAGRD